MTKHPMQPIEVDSDGIVRFKQNAIVRHLLDNGQIDLYDIGKIEFSQEDREQFAQLIGYSLCGYSELPYVREETIEVAYQMEKAGISEDEARIQYLEGIVISLKEFLKKMVPQLFQLAEEDLVD